jgi:hypothetical protein
MNTDGGGRGGGASSIIGRIRLTSKHGWNNSETCNFIHAIEIIER